MERERNGTHKLLKRQSQTCKHDMMNMQTRIYERANNIVEQSVAPCNATGHELIAFELVAPPNRATSSALSTRKPIDMSINGQTRVGQKRACMSIQMANENCTGNGKSKSPQPTLRGGIATSNFGINTTTHNNTNEPTTNANTKPRNATCHASKPTMPTMMKPSKVTADNRCPIRTARSNKIMQPMCAEHLPKPTNIHNMLEHQMLARPIATRKRETLQAIPPTLSMMSSLAKSAARRHSGRRRRTNNGWGGDQIAIKWGPLKQIWHAHGTTNNAADTRRTLWPTANPTPIKQTHVHWVNENTRILKRQW